MSQPFNPTESKSSSQRYVIPSLRKGCRIMTLLSSSPRGLSAIDIARTLQLQIEMVGVRIYTDMAMAHAAGCIGVLVLSGEATKEDARRATQPPELVVSDIGEVGRLLQSRRGQP